MLQRADITPMNGFTNYNVEAFGPSIVSYAETKFDSADAEGLVILSGMLRAPAGQTIASGTVIATLPGVVNIAYSRPFQVNTKGGACRLDVKPTDLTKGTTDIIYNGTAGALVEWVSLNGIVLDSQTRG